MNLYKKTLALGLSIFMACGQAFSTNAVKTKKVVMVGDEKAGKTSICKRIFNEPFDDQYVPTMFGTDFYNIDDVKICLFDASGRPRERGNVEGIIKGASLIVLVYDMSLNWFSGETRESLDSISNWLKLAKDKCPQASVIVVGTKGDLNCNKDLKQLVKDKCDEEGIEYYSNVSAKNGEGIEALKQRILNDDDVSTFSDITPEVIPAKEKCLLI